jgi:hypothetical protein
MSDKHSNESADNGTLFNAFVIAVALAAVIIQVIARLS